MTNFASADSLKTFLQTEQVTLLLAALPAGANPYAYADAIIKNYTDFVPNTNDDDRLLVEIASKLIIWNLSGVQQALAEEERKHRKENYDWAIAQLEAIRASDITISGQDTATAAEDAVVPVYTATAPRVTRW